MLLLDVKSELGLKNEKDVFKLVLFKSLERSFVKSTEYVFVSASGAALTLGSMLFICEVIKLPIAPITPPAVIVETAEVLLLEDPPPIEEVEFVDVEEGVKGLLLEECELDPEVEVSVELHVFCVVTSVVLLAVLGFVGDGVNICI